MIERLIGVITARKDESITLMVNGIGFGLVVAQPAAFQAGTVTVYTYVHWSAERGASVYGFADEQSRVVFLLLLECPKIGPSIALELFSQMTAGQIIECVASSNTAALTRCSGVGVKKAEQIIVSLRDKASKLLLQGAFVTEGLSGGQWQQVFDALINLNYSRQEATRALEHVRQQAGQETPELTVLIRRALSYLAQS